MKLLVNNKSWLCALLMGAMLISIAPTQAQACSLRDVRNAIRSYRFVIIALVSAGILYGYSHKVIKKMVKEYHDRQKIGNQSLKPEQKAGEQKKVDYFETFADIFVKSTKVIGTIFKVVRAATCPSEGKSVNDQWLDDFSQLA